MARGGPWHRTQTALAEALDRSVGWVTASKRKPGWPPKEAKGWNEAKVRAWIRDQPPGRNQRLEPEPATPAPRRGRKAARGTPKGGEQPDAVQEQLDALRSSSDPVELARAGMKLAAERVARSFEAGGAMAAELPNLTKAITAIRLAEKASIDLGVRRGELIPKDVARVTAAAIAQAFVRALNSFETALASQVEVWLSDRNLTERTTEERRRMVTAWVREQGSAVRSNARGGFLQVMDAAIEERGAAAAEKARRKS